MLWFAQTFKVEVAVLKYECPFLGRTPWLLSKYDALGIEIYPGKHLAINTLHTIHIQIVYKMNDCYIAWGLLITEIAFNIWFHCHFTFTSRLTWPQAIVEYIGCVWLTYKLFLSSHMRDVEIYILCVCALQVIMDLNNIIHKSPVGDTGEAYCKFLTCLFLNSFWQKKKLETVM